MKAKVDSGHYNPRPETSGVAAPPEQDLPSDTAEAQAKLLDAHTRAREVSLKERTAASENQNRDQDRTAKERDTMIDLAKEFVEQPQTSTGPDGGKKTTPAPKTSNAGEKAVKVLDQIDKGLKD